MRRLVLSAREISKQRDWQFKLSHRLEIWQAHRQHSGRCACQISKQSCISNYKYHGSETLRGLSIRRVIVYWNRALAVSVSRRICYKNLQFQFVTISACQHVVRVVKSEDCMRREECMLKSPQLFFVHINYMKPTHAMEKGLAKNIAFLSNNTNVVSMNLPSGSWNTNNFKSTGCFVYITMTS